MRRSPAVGRPVANAKVGLDVAQAPLQQIRVVLIDHHPLIRHSLKQLIDSQPHMKVSAEVSDARKGLDAALRLKPHLICVAISLKGGANGIAFIKNIKGLLPDTRILVISMHQESLYAFRALRAGAHGYLMKQEAIKKVLEAIQVVTGGGIYLSEELRQRVILHLVEGGELAESPIDMLSDRELEILQLIGEGMMPKEIVSQLNISAKTVDSHKANICRKLNLPNHAELARFATTWAAREGAC